MPPPAGFPSAVNVNVPYQVTIAVDGSVKIETVDAQEYTLAPKHAQFNGYLVDDILNAFKVKNDSGYPSSANVTVEMVESAGVRTAFATALANQLKTALLSDTSLLNVATDHASLDDYLMDWANKQIVKQLSANGIAAALEAEGLKDMQHTGFNADLTDGANAMYDGLVTITPTVRAVIATQIPNTKWMSAFNAAGEVMDEKLPLYDGGDSMTFQFVITQNFVVEESAQNVGEATGAFGPAPGIPIPGSVKDGGASGVVTSKVLGQYSVDSRTINLVLTRPSPANYPNVRDLAPGFEVPVEPSTTSKDAAAGAATDAYNLAPNGYVQKAAAAKQAYDAWDAENKKKIASDAAAAAVVDALSVYNASIAVQTSALAAAGDLKEGPLHNAAQRAIAATEKARLDWEGLKTAASTALGLLAAAPNDLAELYSRSKLASKAQATAYNTWTLKQKLAAEAADAYEALMDKYRLDMAERVALQESANTAATKALAQWTGLSGEAVASINGLNGVGGARAFANTKHGDWKAAEGEVTTAQGTYNAAKTEANAQTLAAKQILETKAEEVYLAAVAAFNVKRVETLAIIEKANTALGKYVTANGRSDSHLTRTVPDATADLFDPAVSAAVYVAPA